MSLKSRIEALILQISNAKISLRLLNKRSIKNQKNFSIPLMFLRCDRFITINTLLIFIYN